MNEELYTWGWGKYGQLGHGDEVNVSQLRAVDKILLQGQAIAQLSCGFSYNLALTQRGDVYTWGYAKHLNITQSDARHYQTVPRKLKFFQKKGVKIIAASQEHSVVVLGSGEVYTWGGGSYGRLGHGDEQGYLDPRKVEFFEQANVDPNIDEDNAERDASIFVTGVACGLHHTLVVDQTGRVYSWGLGSKGRLGHGDEENQYIPKLVSALDTEKTQVKFVRCGWDHSAVVTEGRGWVYTWGCGRSFQLGGVGLGQKDGETFMTLPIKVVQWSQKKNAKSKGLKVRSMKTLAQAPRIIELSCGGKHNLAVCDKGKVYSWGRGEFGRLGHDDQRHKLYPCQIAALDHANIVAVAGGGYHSMALTSRGVLYTWGNNEHGRLGIRNSTELFIPRPVLNPATKNEKTGIEVKRIFAGAFVSMAFGIDNNQGKKSYAAMHEFACSIQ